MKRSTLKAIAVVMLCGAVVIEYIMLRRLHRVLEPQEHAVAASFSENSQVRTPLGSSACGGLSVRRVDEHDVPTINHNGTDGDERASHEVAQELPNNPSASLKYIYPILERMFESQFISFVHSVLLAQALNRTLVLPTFVDADGQVVTFESIFDPLSLSSIKTTFPSIVTRTRQLGRKGPLSHARVLVGSPETSKRTAEAHSVANPATSWPAQYSLARSDAKKPFSSPNEFIGDLQSHSIEYIELISVVAPLTAVDPVENQWRTPFSTVLQELRYDEAIEHVAWQAISSIRKRHGHFIGMQATSWDRSVGDEGFRTDLASHVNQISEKLTIPALFLAHSEDPKIMNGSVRPKIYTIADLLDFDRSGYADLSHVQQHLVTVLVLQQSSLFVEAVRTPTGRFVVQRRTACGRPSISLCSGESAISVRLKSEEPADLREALVRPGCGNPAF